MTDLAEAAKPANPLRIGDPERIPARRYYDEAFYRLESERLWPHVWQMACRLEQIPAVGDWIEYSNIGKSVIVVRTHAGVKAFHNACRHRGVPLTQGTHGNCKGRGFICPFHGWRYDIEGRNTFVYGRHLFSEALLDPADLALKPCRVELWGGCAFINFDDRAPSFRDTIGSLAERLEAWGVCDLRAEWWFATVLPANWKIAMEAFMEGFHVMRTHPQLQSAVPALYNGMYGDTGGIGQLTNPRMTVRQNIEAHFKHLGLLSSGMGGMVHAKELAIARELIEVELPDDPAQAVPMWYGLLREEITKRLRASGEQVPDLSAVAASDPLGAVEFLFPHYFLLPPAFTGMSSYRVRPLGPESCLFELWSLTHYPKGQEPAPPMEPTLLAHDSPDFPEIPRQDYSNIPMQQKGLHAEGFEFMRLARGVEGLISNYQRIIDGYIEGVAPVKLAKAVSLLAGNFDGKILDLGF